MRFVIKMVSTDNIIRRKRDKLRLKPNCKKALHIAFLDLYPVFEEEIIDNGFAPVARSASISGRAAIISREQIGKVF